MGMAASQARLLLLTARKSDLQYQSTCLNQGKLICAMQASDAAAKYSARKNNNMFTITTADNNQAELSFTSISNAGLSIVNASGKTVIPSYYKGNNEAIAQKLGANHPAVNSYLGEFTSVDKLQKSNINLTDTIPMYDNTGEFEQKTLQKYKTKEQNVYSINGIEQSYDSLTTYLQVSSSEQISKLSSFFNSNSAYGLVLSNNNNFDNYNSSSNSSNSNYTILSNSECRSTETITKQLNATFASEFGKNINTSTNVGRLNNTLMGGNDKKGVIKKYTSYQNREFQEVVTWGKSNAAIASHINSNNSGNDEIDYVSNAEQFITALLKHSTVDDNDDISSNANIMLLNDIDLDDLLQTDGNGGLKEFIEKEMSSCLGEDEFKAYNTALDNIKKLGDIDTKRDNANIEIRKDLTQNISSTFLNLAKAYGFDTNGWTDSDGSIIDCYTSGGVNKGSLNADNVINRLAKYNLDDDNLSKSQQELVKLARDAQKILAMEQKFSTYENGTLSDVQCSDKNEITLSDNSKVSKADLNNWDTIIAKLTETATNAKDLLSSSIEGTISKSTIKGDVLGKIWDKYFSDTTNDKFKETFTNFIQIDKFSGSIGGGGFAINNLKMHGTEEASMFGTLESATLHGIYMENANVLTDSKDVYKSAILAQNVTGNSYTLVSVKGNSLAQAQTKYDKYDANANAYDRYANMLSEGSHRERYASLVYNDKRSAQNLIDTYDNLFGSENPPIKSANGGEFYLTGWNFEAMTNLDGMSVVTSADYGVIATGIRTDADTTDKNNASVTFSSKRNNNLGAYASEARDVRHSSPPQSKNSENVLTALFKAAETIVDSGRSDANNGKIRLYKETTETVTTGEEIDGWDADIKDSDWDVLRENEDGTVTLVATHGEKTEDYTYFEEIRKFYEDQGVSVTTEENDGFLTYTIEGNCVDIAYKAQYEKYKELEETNECKFKDTTNYLIIQQREQINEIDESKICFVDNFDSVIDAKLKNGEWFIQGASLEDETKLVRKDLEEVGIFETTDEQADAIAEAEYQREMREIELKEEQYDAQITKIENELKAIEQDIENQNKILKASIESGYSTGTG